MARSIFNWSLLIVAVSIFALYVYMVSQGDAPPPDPEKIRAFAETAVKSGGVIAALCLLVLAFLAAIAPFVYAVRSADAFTILFAFVALIIVGALLASSRTIIDMVLAAIVYFTSAIVSVMMFSTTRITETIRREQSAGIPAYDDPPRIEPMPPARSLPNSYR